MTPLEGVKRRTPSIAERIIVNAKQMYRWGYQRGIMGNMPIQHIYARSDLQIKKNSFKRVLSDEEIRLVWDALDNSRMTRKNALFVKLCLMYGCRNGEMRLNDIEHGMPAPGNGRCQLKITKRGLNPASQSLGRFLARQ